jgi:hypothetical protein
MLEHVSKTQVKRATVAVWRSDGREWQGTIPQAFRFQITSAMILVSGQFPDEENSRNWHLSPTVPDGSSTGTRDCADRPNGEDDKRFGRGDS